MTRTFKAWLVGLLAIALFTPISVLWLDRPIALFVHNMFGSRQIVVDLGRSHILSISLISACIFLICGLSAIMGRRLSKVGDGDLIMRYQRSGCVCRQERT